MKENLQYPRSSFDAVLLWDLLDYLEQAVVKQVVASLTELLRPGGVVFAMFHSKKPAGFQRYRIADSSTLQMVPSPVICPAQRVYQNREIQDLFGRYRTMKSFIGRDQLRVKVGNEELAWPISDLHADLWNSIRRLVESDACAEGIPSL